MNENVSIKEGNITRKFAPIDKVKVDNTDGTQSIWVPEDDLKTGVLYASDNGIYIASEDGYDAYSEVVIRVEKRIDDGDLIDESDIDWKDIDFDGDIGNFDELDNWDVDTLEEFSDDLEGFDDLFNDNDKWDEEKEKPITEDEMGDFDGDSISGIDPETGNEMEVSLDEDGFLDEEVLPSSIAITRSPFRLTYIDGETISFLGIQVKAYTEDGNVWDNSNYPNGNIPINELIFPVTKAVASGGGKYAGSDLLNGRISFSSAAKNWKESKPAGKYDYYDKMTSIGDVSGSEAATYIKANRGAWLILASKQPGTATETRLYIYESTDFPTIEIYDPPMTYDLVREYTYKNKTVFFAAIQSLSVVNYIPSNDLDFAWTAEKVAWTMIYGNIEDEESKMDVPVQWIRPDGEILETSYQITVISSGEGGGGSDAGWDGNISYDGNDYMLNQNSVVGLSYNPESKKVIAPNIGEYNVNQAIDVGLLIPKE